MIRLSIFEGTYKSFFAVMTYVLRHIIVPPLKKIKNRFPQKREKKMVSESHCYTNTRFVLLKIMLKKATEPSSGKIMKML